MNRLSLRPLRPVQGSLLSLRLPGAHRYWQRARRATAFTFHLPLVVWWIVLIGTVTFGLFLNVYMSYRIAAGQLQLDRLAQDYNRREEINTELLYRIGQETDLNRIALWARNHNYIHQTDVLWLEPIAPYRAFDPVRPVSPEPAPEALRSSTDRITETSSWFQRFRFRLRTQVTQLRTQLQGFTPLPPDAYDELDWKAGTAAESASGLERFLETLRQAANAPAR